MEVYLGKDRKHAITDVTAQRATIKQLTRKLNGHGHKLYFDSYFSFPDFIVIGKSRK
jgi:hypothetical protein